jgi:hypothetical protein
VGSTTTVYINNYFKWSGSTTTMVSYYYEGTYRVSMRTGTGVTSTLRYLLSDHLGSTTVTLDSSGNVLSKLRFKA